MSLLGTKMLPTGKLDCFCANDDSVLVSYNDLRLANSKLVELKYTKEINTKLTSVICNDSIIISDYSALTKQLSKTCKQTKKERNIVLGIGIVFTISTIALTFK